jgi:hypothetical protein
MRFDTCSAIETVIWTMRLAEQTRSADRATILRLFNGAPPFNEATAEENNIQINVNDLVGTNAITQASLQWDNNLQSAANYFIARPDFGPGHKRFEWSQKATRNLNRLLKRKPAMNGQSTGAGKNTLLFGMGPTMWQDRRSVIPKVIPVSSLLIPSETEIDDFEDGLQYFAIFREWNAAQLWDMTHGPKVDPGWNMKMVQSQLDYIRDEVSKSPNMQAYQFMAERTEELLKQDKGLFGSDACPTVDVWDFYFREAENGKGWYRRILLDWGGGSEMTGVMPESKNQVDGKSEFLYSSGKRRFSDSLGQILHCQFGSCAPYAPVKYHGLRGLGWMLYGICDLENRLHCKFNEAVFEQLMWFFQTASGQDLARLKKANFEHMGVIPAGIRFLTAQERFTPNMPLVQMAREWNQKLISDSSTSYTPDFEKAAGGQALTATETMARVNASQALASAIIKKGYSQEKFKYQEMFRRACLKNSKDPIATEFRKRCLQDGIPEEMLDPEKWDIEPEQILGGGNKTVQMAIVGFLQQIRKNLPPNGQRLVDNLSVSAATEIPELAEEIAPIGDNKTASRSMTNAQDATPRILRGMPYTLPDDAVHEDFAVVWLHDLAFEVQKAQQRGGMASQEDLMGMAGLVTNIQGVLSIMGADKDKDEREKVKMLEGHLSDLSNHVKAFAQRLQQQMQSQAKQQGQQPGGNGAETAGKVQSMLITAQAKAKITENSAAQRTAQKQKQWEMGERRKDLQTQAEIGREGTRTRHQLLAERMRALTE